MQQLLNDDIQNFRKALEAEKKRVDIRIEELVLQDPFSDKDRLLDNAAVDTEASEESNHDRFAALIDELKVEKSAIVAALKRIEEHVYGMCGNCTLPIGPSRLIAIPTANLCMSCEQKKKA